VGRELDYTPRQVTMALTALVRDRGDVEVTAARLIGDEFMVSADTLALWKTDTHAEQYKRIEEHIGRETERDAITTAQQTSSAAASCKLELLERVGEIRAPGARLPGAARRVNDATAKATTELMQLTGRPVNGNAGDASVEAMTRLVTGLQELGLVKLAPSIAETISDADDPRSAGSSISLK
jgi:hypothetical protein